MIGTKTKKYAVAVSKNVMISEVKMRHGMFGARNPGNFSKKFPKFLRDRSRPQGAGQIETIQPLIALNPKLQS